MRRGPITKNPNLHPVAAGPASRHRFGNIIRIKGIDGSVVDGRRGLVILIADGNNRLRAASRK
jgi:hypothetical protein